MLVTQATPTRLIPATMVPTTIPATATIIAVRTTALIGARVDGLPAEFIDDITAGTKGPGWTRQATCWANPRPDTLFNMSPALPNRPGGQGYKSQRLGG